MVLSAMCGRITQVRARQMGFARLPYFVRGHLLACMVMGIGPCCFFHWPGGRRTRWTRPCPARSARASGGDQSGESCPGECRARLPPLPAAPAPATRRRSLRPLKGKPPFGTNRRAHSRGCQSRAGSDFRYRSAQSPGDRPRKAGFSIYENNAQQKSRASLQRTRRSRSESSLTLAEAWRTRSTGRGTPSSRFCKPPIRKTNSL